MGNILNKIVNNNALFVGVIIVLCIILIALVILIVRSYRENKKINIYEEELEDDDIKKVKNVKKEDIIETPDTHEEPQKDDDIKVLEEAPIIKEELQEDLESEKEIEQRYNEEKEKEIEEILEDNPGNEIEQLLSKMEADSKLKPEDVVANFEQEQEAQSIISYKELVDAVKNRQEDIYEDELESKPLTTVSDFMKKKEAEELENSAIISVRDITEEPKEEVINTGVENATDKKEGIESSKFRKTEVISPVFGIVEESSKSSHKGTIDETIDLTDIDLSDVDFGLIKEPKQELREEDAAITALDEIYKHMAEDLLKNNEDLGETASLEELTKNEEFLQSLKDFRKKL